MNRDRRKSFNEAQEKVNELDLLGKKPSDTDMYCQYQRRNSFGLDPNMKIYRIFQREFYENDTKNGVLTLPRAIANVWNDELENPLSNVTERIKNYDLKQNETYYWGSVVENYFALCWTNRENPTDGDWSSFSHGKPAVRIETTVQKLLDRVMVLNDPSYMHKSWLIDVEYKDQNFIKQMRNPEEVKRRIESSGSELVLSAAIVRGSNSAENEVRYLFDNFGTDRIAIEEIEAVDEYGEQQKTELIRLCFDWDGFVDNIIKSP